MSLLNKKHLFLASIQVEYLINLLERDQAVLFGRDEYPRNRDQVVLEVQAHFLDVKLGFLMDYWFEVVVSHLEYEIGKAGFLSTNLNEKLFKAAERTVKDCHENLVLFLQQKVQSFR